MLNLFFPLTLSWHEQAPYKNVLFLSLVTTFLYFDGKIEYMDQQQQVMYGQLSAQVAQSTRRLSQLVNDTDDIELAISDSQELQKRFNESLHLEVSVLQGQLDKVRSSLTESQKLSGRTLLRFRELVKQDAVATLSEKIDAWPLEFFISRSEFDALLAEKLQARR